ncbi:MAG: hypothetical protein ACRELZ_20445 [Candidatus Rokuibacteriota bacterium]
MKASKGRVKLLRVPRSAARSAKRRTVRVPKVNPRVTPQEALRILRRFPGGERVIKQLQQAGKKI